MKCAYKLLLYYEIQILAAFLNWEFRKPFHSSEIYNAIILIFLEPLPAFGSTASIYKTLPFET